MDTSTNIDEDSNDEESRKSFAKVINKFVDNTSMQGVGYIKNSKAIAAKIIWSILLIGAVVVMGLHLFFLVNNYMLWPKKTTLSLGFNNLLLPSVTICNVNTFRSSQIHQTSEEMKKLLKKVHPSQFDKLKPKTPDVEPDPTIGGDNPDPTIGGDNPDPTIGGDNPDPTIGGDNPDPTIGGDNPDPTIGGDTTTTDNGGNPDPTIGGDTTTTDNGGSPDPTIGGDTTTTDNGGNPDPTIGGDTTTTDNGGSPDPNVDDSTITSPDYIDPDPSDSNTIDYPDGGRKKRNTDDVDDGDLYDDDYNYDSYDDYDPGISGARDTIFLVRQRFTKYFMAIPRSKRIEIGHDLSKMLVRCNFHGFQCYAENFTVSQSAEYGNCFTLDTTKFLVRQPGPSYGLTMQLYMRTHEYLPGITTGYGARLHLHYPNTIPFPDSSGSFVQASHETHIALKQTNIKRIGKPYGECDNGDEFLRLYGKEYNRASCQYMCKSTTMVKECGCYEKKDDELFQTSKVKVKACSTRREFQCLVNVTRKVLSKSLTCNCLDPCFETSYTMTSTSREWPTDDYSILIREAICESIPGDCILLKSLLKDELRRNFIKLKIYFQDLNYANIKESKDIEDSQFASDVGGAIGLWIGLSMLSTFEIVQLVYEVFEYFFYYKMCRSINKRTEIKRSKTDNKISPEFKKEEESEKQNIGGRIMQTPIGSETFYHRDSFQSSEKPLFETSSDFPSYRYYKGKY